MEICIVRHAIAEDRGARFPTDAERPLTDRGRQRMREAATGLRLLYTPEVVVSSPLRRAVQTAEILIDAYGLPSMEIHNGLATGDDDGLLEFLGGLGRERVAVVGHEPHVSGTLSYLATGDHDRIGSLFKKGAAALLSCPGEPTPGRFGLHWLMQPAALRGVGRGGQSDEHD